MNSRPNLEIAARYIYENFAPSDRLAIVLINRQTEKVLQRLSTAAVIATDDMLDWLGRRNEDRSEVYVSMNALAPQATGRTRRDVATVRHVYLDFDNDGTAAMEAMLRRSDSPKPNYVLNTSPGKCQAVWKVDRFGKDEAEALQKGMAREYGADCAATDCARVLRLPRFFNHKYDPPHLVTVTSLAQGVYSPAHFPVPDPQCSRTHTRPTQGRSVRVDGGLSRSERDWAFVKRALARGDDPPRS